MSEADRQLLLEVHERLVHRYDVERWHWRDDTPSLDVCLGAILVQHTSWSNVERALMSLEVAGAYSLDAIAALPEDELASTIRPAGTPLTKARRLKAFSILARRNGGLEGLLAKPPVELRATLLATPGIGPETADAILLYAARAPVVVHDAYTARLFRRLGCGPEKDGYNRWQAWLEARLPLDGAFRRADHAAIVLHCRETCRARPKCAACVLLDVCAYGHASSMVTDGVQRWT